jgi:hypothetical protein
MFQILISKGSLQSKSTFIKKNRRNIPHLLAKYHFYLEDANKDICQVKKKHWNGKG